MAPMTPGVAYGKLRALAGRRGAGAEAVAAVFTRRSGA